MHCRNRAAWPPCTSVDLQNQIAAQRAPVVASALVNSHLELVPAAPRLYQLEALLKVLLPLLLLPSRAHDAPPLPPAAAAPVCRPATAVPAFARGLAPDPRLACRSPPVWAASCRFHCCLSLFAAGAAVWSRPCG